MSTTRELHRLGQSSRRLNDGSEQLNHMIAEIDRLLERLAIGLDYVHPRPIAEQSTTDSVGKRAIEVSFLGYLRLQGGYHLAVRTVKVLESKAALATEVPGSVVPLLHAPRRLRYQAVELLPELMAGLAEQVEDMVGAMEHRCNIARAVMQHLESIAGPLEPPPTASDARWQAVAIPEPTAAEGAGSPADGSKRRTVLVEPSAGSSADSAPYRRKTLPATSGGTST